ncbi:ATP-dependent DNA helicase RecG [Bifidobacterium myosotis]|nr:ATP-dependent DNA helicase RecG [Bifidobacterium myosotis]
MSITMDTALAALITNKRRVSALKSLGVVTVGDALTYYPFRVTDPVPLRAIREARIGQTMAFAATIRDLRVVPMNARRGYRLEATVDDADFARSRRVAGGLARLTFFSYRKSYVDWVSMRLRAGSVVVISGMPGEYMGQLQFTHPDILTVAPTMRSVAAGRAVSGVMAPGQDEFAVAEGLVPAAGPVAAGPAPDGGPVPTGLPTGQLPAQPNGQARRSIHESPSPALKYDADTVGEGLARVCRPRPVYHASSRISSEHIHETILNLLWMMGVRGSAAGSDSSESGLVAPSTEVIAIQPGESASAQTAVAGQAADSVAGSAVASSGAIPDILPEDIRVAKGLMHRAEAFLAIHDPSTKHRFDHAIETLRYEEAFVSQTSLVRARLHAHKSSAHPCPLNVVSAVAGAVGVGAAAVAVGSRNVPVDSVDADAGSGTADGIGAGAAIRSANASPDTPALNLRDRFIASLPFTLTNGQRQVVNDIASDLARDWPMQRLLQGEVGSGKTVVALAAMLQAVGAGYQAVLVAPTQVLAEQHYETIRAMLARLRDADAVVAGISEAVGAANAAKTTGIADASGPRSDSGVTDTAGKSASVPATPAVPVTLLTGGMKLAARRKALAEAASGAPGIIVATHAAFSKTFQAPHLALVVIDEQHRFGVEQRESLNAKSDDGTTPHLLVMTATPIPRTAAMTWFGDLDISWLTELPGGRKPIRTVVVNETDANTMGRMFAHIRARIDAGERAYIVCPRIDMEESGDGSAEGASHAGSEAGGTSARASRSSRGRGRAGEVGIEDPYETFDDNGETVARPPLHSVEEIAGRLQKLPQFAGIRFATLTGRDKDDVKTQVMADFVNGATPVLVSTTVIEVGVDVKQASCIVIFDADRYGLSQLHQLRGRVGRGGTNSWAFLISRAEPGSTAEQRLEVIHHSLDGAEIAQADLEFRGAGDVLGDAQSGGKSSLKLLRVVKDADMIADARARAERLLAADPDLAGEVQLAGAVLDFTRGNETFLTSS